MEPDLLFDRAALTSTEAGVMLRAWRPSDTGWLVHACADAAILRWWRDGHLLTEENASRLILEFRERLAVRRSAQLAVFHGATGALAGYVGVDGIDHQERIEEVSYWTATGTRRPGVASSALQVLSPWALNTFGLLRLVAYMNPANIASRRVAEKAGYRRGDVQQTRLGPGVTYVLDADP